LLRSVFDKTAWLRDREITEEWPVAGLPESVHVDNAAEFKSRAFRRACENEGIAVIYRPPAQPRFGGHIERLIGTMMGAVHVLPGTTFRGPQDRGDCKPAPGIPADCLRFVRLTRPLQVCRRCGTDHKPAEASGAVLKSWMQGWRITCRACGSLLTDVVG
jgi:transposase InsO family protein